MTTRLRAGSVLFSPIAALALLAAGCARTVAGTPSGATPKLTTPVSVSRQELSIAGASGSSTITAEIDGTVHGSVNKLPFRRALIRETDPALSAVVDLLSTYVRR